jgi:immune inhibitor A
MTQHHRLSHLIGGMALAVLGLCLSGQLFCADAMPPYLDAKGQPTSPQMASAIRTYDQMRESFAERGIDQPGGGLAAGYHATGNFNILAICVDFPDKPSTVAAGKFDTLLYSATVSSVRRFYSEMSHATLTLVTVNLPSATGWQHLPTNYSYYVNSNYGLGGYPQNTQKLCEDLVDLVNPVVNFANYDNDGNGYVDGIVIIHPGRGAEFSGSISDVWSHKWGITPRLRDGVYISAYTIQPEYWNSPGDMTIGVYAHEIGHLFGLPDLYDTDGSSRGIGKWSLMSGGSWNGTLGNSPAHMDAWCKSQLGWVTPINVGSNMTGATIPRITDSAKVFRIWANGTVGNEYYLIENRQKTGYDTYLPGSGLCIWHIDDSKSSNNTEWYPGHTSSGNLWVALEQADGLWEMEKNLDQGDGADPYPGTGNQTTFSAATTPNSNAYDGTQTFVTITNISPSSALMSCDFQVSLVSDVKDGDGGVPNDYKTVLHNSPNPFNPATTIEFSNDVERPVTLAVYDILGRRLTTLWNGTLQAGPHQMVWDGVDEHGNQAASGVYLARLDTAGKTTVRKMVLLR